MEEKIKELTLLLLYLNSWQESLGEDKFNRSWKGHDFEAINELINDGFLTDSGYKSKSVYFTNDGVEKAKELISKYLTE